MSTHTTDSLAVPRRAKVRAAQLNGVDAVEVSDDGLLLTVTFLGKAPHGLCPRTSASTAADASPGSRLST